jgi:hypothetical protein
VIDLAIKTMVELAVKKAWADFGAILVVALLFVCTGLCLVGALSIAYVNMAGGWSFTRSEVVTVGG